MKWQPIETAPKQGRILVCGGDVGDVQTAYIYCGEVVCDVGAHNRLSGDPPDKPFYWMPLPEPPNDH